MNTNDDKITQTPRSIERALGILEQFIDNEALGVTELSKMTGLSKSTVHLILKALEKRKYIVQEPVTGRYALGAKILQLAGGMLRNQQLTKIAEPILRRLTQEISEGAALSIPDGNHVLYVLTVDSPWSVQSIVRVGARAPMYCTGSGKAMLAFFPEERVRSIIEKGLERMTDNTMIDPAKLLQSLEAVRKAGYAFNDEEFERGLRSVGAPVFDYRGEVVASVHVGVPTARLPLDSIENLGRKVIQVAKEISANLGHFDHEYVGDGNGCI